MVGTGSLAETGIEISRRLTHFADITAGAKQVTEAALQLPEQDRLQVASAIWKSMGGTDEHLADLIARARAQDFETGKVTPKSQAEVFQEARAAL